MFFLSFYAYHGVSNFGSVAQVYPLPYQGIR